MTVGERIQSLRKQQNLTQKELGKRCGIAEPTIRRYELGKLKPKITTVAKIADALGAELLELTSGVPNYPITFKIPTPELERALEQRDQAWRDYVARRFNDAYIWKESKNRDRLNVAFDSLNSSGQDEAVKRVEELTEIPRYRAEPTSDLPPDPAGDTDTPAAQDAPEGAEEGGETG